MYQAEHVANTIIYTARKAGQKISMTKLQQIMYLVYAEYYKLTNSQLFMNKFEAWTYGPVITEIYYAYVNTFGKETTKDLRTYIPDLKTCLPPYQKKDDMLIQALTTVWDEYGKKTINELCKITKAQNSAWYKAIQNNQRFLNEEDIKQEIIN